MPMTPRSKSFGTRSAGIAACSSISRTCGATSREANSSTDSNNSCSSSASLVRGERRDAVVSGKLPDSIIEEQALVPRRASKLTVMPITPFRLAGALIIAGALGTASVVARVQQTSKPAPEQPAPKDPPPQTQGQPAPPDGQPSGQSGQPAQGQTGQPAQGQAPPDQPQRPTFRTDINFVRVDVIVTDKKGEPVTDLTEKDFQVWEDGQPQDVESFKLFKIDAMTQTTPARPIRSTYDEESEAQRPDVRLFAFFLDDYHVRRGNSMRSRIALADFVRRQIAPQDMVGLMYPLMPTGDVIMDRNHESTAHAIEQFDGRKYNYVPMNQFEEQYANYPASIVEQVRNDVSLSALKGLIIKLGGLREGRKALILVSEGYTDYLPPQMRSQNAQLKGGQCRSVCWRLDGRAARALLQSGRNDVAPERYLRPRQSQQRVVLRRRPARTCGI